MPSIDESITRFREQINRGDIHGARWTLQKLQSRDSTHLGVIAATALHECKTGHFDSALDMLAYAIRQHPDSAMLHQELAYTYNAIGDLTSAERELRETLRLDPDRPESLGLLAQYLVDRVEYEECWPMLAKLIQLAPKNDRGWNLLACRQLAVGLLDQAEQAYEHALEINPIDSGTASNRAMLSNYRDDLEPAGVFAIHRDWANRFARKVVPITPHAARRPGRLRVGYVSPDFRLHSVSLFFEHVLAHHDRKNFEITCYSLVDAPDATTARMQATAENWRDIARKTGTDAAKQIHHDEIDLLIDLAGHTANNRLGIFALKPAPKQATWLGYPNTSGIDQMDYRLTDAVADPSELAQTWHSEKLLRLPGTFFCYGGPVGDCPAPAGDPPSSKSNGLITFAVPTMVAKVRPRMIRAWSEILARVPRSRLVINAIGVDTQSARDWILQEFTTHAIDPARIELRGRIPFTDYLRRHDEWDLCLDTSPFNGHTTTCHAMWMGVPIITLAGRMHAGRMGASVLHAAELDDCIAQTSDEYVTRAVNLAGNVDRRRELRRSLRDRMRASNMTNAKAFTTTLEVAFRQMAGAQD